MATIDPRALRGNWSYPTAVRFGAGRIAELPDACAALGIARPLLITDPGLAGHAIGERVLAIARASLPIALFADVRPNPTGADVAAGVEALRQGGHDGVIALGGGSALDAAKAIAFMAAQERPIWDFEDRGDNWRRAQHGGARAGRGGADHRRHRLRGRARRGDHQGGQHEKCIIFHPRMLPGQVIADPELTLGLPPNLTAWTGIDALSHSLEALCAPGFHPHGRRHRDRGDPPDPSLAGGRGRGRPGPRRPLVHAGGGEHGRGRLPKGAWRHACARPSDRRPAGSPPRPDHRDRHALCAGHQPAGDRGAAGGAGPGPRPCSGRFRRPARLDHRLCGAISRSRTTSRRSAWPRSMCRSWRRAPRPTRAPAAIRVALDEAGYAALYRRALSGRLAREAPAKGAVA